MFKHSLGCLITSNVSGLTGIVVARAEHLYGCNRYYIQPKVSDNDMKVPDGWWVDEGDIVFKKQVIIFNEEKEVTARPGGLMDKVK